MLADLLLLAGLVLLVVAGFLVSVVAGFVLAGLGCLLLSVALVDGNGLPWRRS